ncbi:MAG: hypothetical protein C4535_17975 [Comamonadaceae bacterium]|nr:MAG: hypothetical protein C4535_17975 [Comamonadaceae bacterium]
MLLHGLFDRGMQEVRGVQDLHEGFVEAVRLLRVGGVDGNLLQFVQGLGQQGLRLQEREVVLERGLDLVAQQGLVVRGALRGTEPAGCFPLPACRSRTGTASRRRDPAAPEIRVFTDVVEARWRGASIPLKRFCFATKWRWQ